MKEIEVKFLEIDPKALQRKLRKLGARKILDARVESIMFDFPNWRLRKNKESLRLRRAGKHCFVTHKKLISKKKYKMHHETEFDVSDWNLVRRVFKTIGLKEKEKHTKHRISWKLGKVRIEIDKCRAVPTYTELEGPQAAIKKVAKQLGFDMRDAKPWSGKELGKHYGFSYSFED